MMMPRDVLLVLAVACPFDRVAAFAPSVPGAVWTGRGACTPEIPSSCPASLPRSLVPLRANLQREHDFGIDRSKVDVLFDRLAALNVDIAQDIEEKFIRGSGAGGQKINKTSNNVQMTHQREPPSSAPTPSDRCLHCLHMCAL